MSGLRALFFDAGNTLVFADCERTLQPLTRRQIQPTRAQIHSAERAARIFRDSQATPEAIHSADQHYWDIYYSHLVKLLDQDDPQLVAELVSATRVSACWCKLRPGTREILLRLRQRFKLGVISNADGTIADVFRSLGLGDCFDSFTDSGIVGVEKPHPRIFEAAVESLGVTAKDSLYIGDIYAIDYLGATAAGLQAMLMDVYGTYSDTTLPRVASLEELEEKLRESAG